ncbi:hypothetical protein GIB67_028814 [Kingdonia uniflora]|uniref:MYB transcription factor n=1 Tax=Kingdonia uniflora TaxID=39325 RepID=A0A7J7LTA9_9MAGN|nr:hypothetical protein GIB67_028814 [Kingdonia uniflora]
MVETMKKKQKKSFTSEDDMSPLLNRYSPTTIIALLQEIYQFADTKMDWKSIVKKTSTGITNPREYQNLWRHLAYRLALSENVEDGVEPLDDDSDLESELEVYPTVTVEESQEAGAYAKVLLASGLPSDPNCETAEAPLIINIPNGHASRGPLDDSQPFCSQGKNITIPVTVQVQQLPTGMASTEGLEGNGPATGGLPQKKKKIPWTQEEDKILIAAVEEYGEKNWAIIIRKYFNGERTNSQLAQKWAFIKKRNPHLVPGGSVPTGASASSLLSESQQATLATTRFSIESAIKMPLLNRFISAGSTASTPNSNSQSSSPITPGEASGSLQKGVSKPRLPPKKLSTAPAMAPAGPNSMIQAAAVAAGARIANPSTAASLLKAAQSKNVVRIRPGGGNLLITSMSGATSATNQSGKPSNVHYMRTGLASASANYSTVMPSVPQSAKLKAGDLPVGSTASSPMCIDSNGTTEASISGEIEVCGSKNMPKGLGQNNKAALPDTEIIKETQTTMTGRMDEMYQTNSASQIDSSVIPSVPQSANSRTADLPVPTESPSPMCVDSNVKTEVDTHENMEVSSSDNTPIEFEQNDKTVLPDAEVVKESQRTTEMGEKDQTALVSQTESQNM